MIDGDIFVKITFTLHIMHRYLPTDSSTNISLLPTSEAEVNWTTFRNETDKILRFIGISFTLKIMISRIS